MEKTVDLIFELGQLKRQKRTGWWLAGVKDPESVAEHAWRAAQIGYILAVMEGEDNPEKIAAMLVVHDNAETRLGDINKVTARYFRKSESEARAFTDQIAGLDKRVAAGWQAFFTETETGSTKAGMIAKDAEFLETAFQAREYADLGYRSAANWCLRIGKKLRTKSARKLFAAMKKREFNDWWRGLKAKD